MILLSCRQDAGGVSNTESVMGRGGIVTMLFGRSPAWAHAGVFLAVLAGVFVVSGGAIAASAPDSAGVLVLADSNGEGHFGGTLYDGLRALRDPKTGTPLNVSIFAKCGAGASDWVDRERAAIDCGAWRCDNGRTISQCMHFTGGSIPALRELYGELGAQRRVTVVALGLNMIIGKRQTKLADAVQLAEAIRAQGSACIWVGPPQAGDLFVDIAVFDSFVADLRKTVTQHGCRYVASDDKTDRRNLGVHTKDDHYDKPAAIAWANGVLREMLQPRGKGEPSLLDLLKAGIQP